MIYIEFVLDRTLAGIFMSDVAMDGGPDILGSIVDNTIRESHEKNYDFRPTIVHMREGRILNGVVNF